MYANKCDTYSIIVHRTNRITKYILIKNLNVLSLNFQIFYCGCGMMSSVRLCVSCVWSAGWAVWGMPCAARRPGQDGGSARETRPQRRAWIPWDWRERPARESKALNIGSSGRWSFVWHVMILLGRFDLWLRFEIQRTYFIFLSFPRKVRHFSLPWGCVCVPFLHSRRQAAHGKSPIYCQTVILAGKSHFAKKIYIILKHLYFPFCSLLVFQQ